MVGTRYKFNIVVTKFRLSTPLMGSAFFFLLYLVSCGGDGPKGEATDDQLITIYIQKGAIQCEDSSGLTLQSSEQKLIMLGIDVISSSCALNNLVDIKEECGESTAEIIIHEIPEVSLVDARKAGYESTEHIFGEYTPIDCA